MPILPLYEFRLQSEGGFLLTGPGCGERIICSNVLSAYDYWLCHLAPADATIVAGDYRGMFSGPCRARQT